MTLRHPVVDIGASNVEDFVSLMRDYHVSHEDFDAFVAPTVPALKQQVDSISTLRALTGEIGVPANSIRVVFNTVNLKDDVSKIFSKIFDYYAGNRNFVLNRDAVIYENPIYEKIEAFDRSIIDIRQYDEANGRSRGIGRIELAAWIVCAMLASAALTGGALAALRLLSI